MAGVGQVSPARCEKGLWRRGLFARVHVEGIGGGGGSGNGSGGKEGVHGEGEVGFRGRKGNRVCGKGRRRGSIGKEGVHGEGGLQGEGVSGEEGKKGLWGRKRKGVCG